jgi:formate hydrogenlyase subunit 3/multisubunit Na+/H+ antiporter MnhD subunit
MMGHNGIAGLLLEMGAFAAIMLIPSRQEGAAMTGMRALMLLALGGAVILLSAWAIESRAVNPDAAFLGQLASLALVIGFGLAFGVAPFHAWLPPVFRYGSPLLRYCSVLCWVS